MSNQHSHLIKLGKKKGPENGGWWKYIALYYLSVERDLRFLTGLLKIRTNKTREGRIKHQNLISVTKNAWLLVSECFRKCWSPGIFTQQSTENRSGGNVFHRLRTHNPLKHIRFHSCLPGRRIWDYHEHRLTTTGQLKTFFSPLIITCSVSVIPSML